MARRRARTYVRGRALLAWLSIALAVAVGLALLWTRGGGATETGVSPRASTTTPDTAPVSSLPGSSSSQRVASSGEPPVEATGTTAAGILRGTVATPEGVPFPERWTLVVEPAEGLEGSERAMRRQLDLDDSQREFDVRDLPLGGYAVSASAAGMTTRTMHVLLVRGSSHRVLHMVMTPAGFIDGSLVEVGGSPAEGVTVTLENMVTGEQRSADTDPAGIYLFEGVTDGRYTISFGEPAAPLLGPEELAFKAPSMRYPRRSIPHTISVRFQVVDEFMNPLAGAAIRGFGSAGGPIDLFADGAGIAIAKALPEGRYRVNADHESGRRGKATFELTATANEIFIEIACRP